MKVAGKQSPKHLKFVDKDGNEVTLHERTWREHILGSPGRAFLEYNLDAISQTLRSPDLIRQSSGNRTSKLYYRAWESFEYRPGIRLPVNDGNTHLVVVVKHDRFVQTVYVTAKIKQGETLWQKS